MHDTLNDRFRKKKKMLWHGLRYFYFTLLEIEKNRIISDCTLRKNINIPIKRNVRANSNIDTIGSFHICLIMWKN